jgi:Fic family protein
MLYVFSQIELFGGVEVNSEQIGKILDISRPTCTKNIKTLLENELLVNLKDGKTNYYRINAEKFNYK